LDETFKGYRVNGRTTGGTHWPILECTHFLSTQKAYQRSPFEAKNVELTYKVQDTRKMIVFHYI